MSFLIDSDYQYEFISFLQNIYDFFLEFKEKKYK